MPQPQPHPGALSLVVFVIALTGGCAGDSGGRAFDTGMSSTGTVDVEALTAVVEGEMAELGVTAMSMAILQGGVPVWSGGFGTLAPGDPTPVDADTLFRVASVTKPMTALALLQNVDAGCLQLDDAVNEHIPFEIGVQPDHSENFLVGHTLTHTGGLLDHEIQSGQEGDGFIEPFLEEFQFAGGFLAPPGRMYNYSNTNLVVAGRLVEVCSGQSFRAYMEQEVWSPLGMDRTAFDQATVLEDGNHAAGITTLLEESSGEDLIVGPESYAAANLWPAMGAWSSADDLAQLAVFLLDGNEQVLSSSLTDAMRSSQVERLEGFPDAGHGYGLNIKTGVEIGGSRYPVRMLSHTGFLFGYSSFLYVVPELDIAVIALLNRDSVYPEQSIDAALDLASQVDPGPLSVLEPDPSTFGDFVGTYTHEYVMGDFIFSLDGETLQVSVPSLDDSGVDYETDLVAVRPDNFEMRIDGRTQLLSFIRDETGAVEFVRNRYYVGALSERGNARQVAPVPPGFLR